MVILLSLSPSAGIIGVYSYVCFFVCLGSSYLAQAQVSLDRITYVAQAGLKLFSFCFCFSFWIGTLQLPVSSSSSAYTSMPSKSNAFGLQIELAEYLKLQVTQAP